MSVFDSVSLFAIMVTLALIPSTSVALVVTRSATAGIANGVAVALGIVLGDLFFVLLAVLGLSVVAETMGGLFLAIKYAGVAYLIWFGFSLLTTKNGTAIAANREKRRGSIVASFLAGFFLTLGDVKAIFFYVSLLPTFVDPATLSLSELWSVILITIVAVGGVKTVYAFSARKIAAISQGLKFERGAKKIAGSLMIGAGAYLIVKA